MSQGSRGNDDDSMLPTYLPLHAATKRPAESGWAKPEYEGVELGDHVGMRLDGYAVVDCETFEAGYAFLEENPTPYVVRTRRGLHLYYAAAEGEHSRPIVPGLIDLKTGIGSYVLPAGALHPSGVRYIVDDTWGDDIPPVPSALPPLPVATLARIEVRKPQKAPVDAADEAPIAEGGREAELMRIGGLWRRQGLNREGMLHGLMQVNVERCIPPLPDSALTRMTNSLMQYEPEPDITYSLAESGLTVPEGYVSRLHTAVDRRSRRQPPWLVEHVLPETGIGQIFGASYTGKSLVALDLMLRLTNGLPEWFGHPINVQGPVVYVMMEGVFDSQLRINAWLAGHEHLADMTDDDLYTLDEEAVNLADIESIARIEQDIAALGIEPVLIVIDTQSLATPGVDENSNTDMNLMLSNLKQWSTRRQCPVLTVHHTGKDPDKGSRGASAVFAGMDLVIEVRDKAMRVRKVKGYKPAPEVLFDLIETDASVFVEPDLLGGVAVKSIGQLIMEKIEAGQDTMTKTEIIDFFGQTNKVRREFGALAESGEIEEFDTGTGKGASKRKVWHTTGQVWADFSEASDDPADHDDDAARADYAEIKALEASNRPSDPT